MSEVFSDQSPGPSRLIRREDRHRMRVEGMSGELVTPSTAALVRVAVWTLDVDGSSGPEPVTDRPGEECILVVAGRLEVTLEEERYVLREGDSLTFSCGEPHRLRNVAAERTIVVVTHAPPNF